MRINITHVRHRKKIETKRRGIDYEEEHRFSYDNSSGHCCSYRMRKPKTTETTAAATTAVERQQQPTRQQRLESKEADKTEAAAAAEGSLKARFENVDPKGHLGKVLAAGKITMGTSP